MAVDKRYDFFAVPQGVAVATNFVHQIQAKFTQLGSRDGEGCV